MDSITLKKTLNKNAEDNQSKAAENTIARNQKVLQIEELKEALNNALDMVEGKKSRKYLKDILNG